MKRVAVVLLLVACLFPAVSARAEDEGCGIMQPDDETRQEWMAEDLSLPEEYYDPAIESPRGGSFSLLGHLPYLPYQRNQLNCGNCWTWAGTGCVEIANNIDNGVWKRLSIQYINSCGSNTALKYCCCGGNLSRFAQWYAARGKFIPWSNSRAGFADAARKCAQGASAVSCGSITKAPYYPINSIAAATITTYGAGQAKAVARIKNSLRQNKGVYFGFFLPDNQSWDDFRSFWNNYGETAVYNFAQWSGRPWVDGEGGGHAVLIVGYNDNVANPYWIVVNSWGTANGIRPNGIFRMKMYTDYDAYVNYPAAGNAMLLFQTLNVDLGHAAASPPIRLGTSGTRFSHIEDAMVIYASARAISTPFYPFVRVVTPYYGTAYMSPWGGIQAYPMPFTRTPMTVPSAISSVPILKLYWQNYGKGTYYLEGGGVNAAQPLTASGGLNYIGPVHRTAITLY